MIIKSITLEKAFTSNKRETVKAIVSTGDKTESFVSPAGTSAAGVV